MGELTEIRGRSFLSLLALLISTILVVLAPAALAGTATQRDLVTPHWGSITKDYDDLCATGAPRSHYAYDINQPGDDDRDDPVYAAYAGTVIEKGNDAAWGNYIALRHGGSGYWTFYTHLLALPGHAIGAKIRRGQEVGRAGNSGSLSDGYHLHFAVLRNPSDALDYTTGVNFDSALGCGHDVSQAALRTEILHTFSGLRVGLRWLLRTTLTTGSVNIDQLYGYSSDDAITGDWDRDGIDTPGVVRGNVWYLNNWFDGTSDIAPFGWGFASDIKLSGDWDGDGYDTPGLFRPPRTWFLSNDFLGTLYRTFDYGTPGDQPVVGDWNGDGNDSIGIIRGNRWMLRDSNTAGLPNHDFLWANSTDLKFAGNWDACCSAPSTLSDTPGVFRTNTWHYSNNLTGVSNGSFVYGDDLDTPKEGDWHEFAEGDTPGVVRAQD